jgi:UDP-glucose 4-epimerase
VLIADPAKAMRHLGWRAERSDIDTIVRTALAWHQRTRVSA